VAAVVEEVESLLARLACVLERAHEMDLGKRKYSRVEPVQMNALAWVMAMKPCMMTCCHAAQAQVGDPAYIVEMALAMGPGTYCHVEPPQTSAPALATEMGHAMEPGKMSFARVKPSQTIDPAFAVAMEPGKMNYFHVASVLADDLACTTETAHAMVYDMRYSHGAWSWAGILACSRGMAHEMSPGKMKSCHAL
jgi:hypothetical protein